MGPRVCVFCNRDFVVFTCTVSLVPLISFHPHETHRVLARMKSNCFYLFQTATSADQNMTNSWESAKKETQNLYGNFMKRHGSPLSQCSEGDRGQGEGTKAEICRNSKAQMAPRQVSYYSWSSPLKKHDSIHLHQRRQMGQ